MSEITDEAEAGYTRWLVSGLASQAQEINRLREELGKKTGCLPNCPDCEKEFAAKNEESYLCQNCNCTYSYFKTSEPRNLLEENERLVTRIIQHRKALGHVMSPSVPVDPDIVNKREKALESQLQQLREENNRLRNVISETSLTEKLLRADVKMLRAELDQVKREKEENESIAKHKLEVKQEAVDEAMTEVYQLRTELAEKDKVLEWYGDTTKYESGFKSAEPIEPDVIFDAGNRARSIISQYKGESK